MAKYTYANKVLPQLFYILIQEIRKSGDIDQKYSCNWEVREDEQSCVCLNMNDVLNLHPVVQILS